MHSRPFKSCSDGRFTTGLHYASGNAKALGAELGVFHAMVIADDEFYGFSRLVIGLGVYLERSQNGVDFASV